VQWQSKVREEWKKGVKYQKKKTLQWRRDKNSGTTGEKKKIYIEGE